MTNLPNSEYENCHGEGEEAKQEPEVSGLATPTTRKKIVIFLTL